MKPYSFFLALPLLLTLACGGSSSLKPTGGVSGAYEFVVTSNVTGAVTLVEANLAANGNASGANGASQVQILTLLQKTWYVNGVCAGPTPGQNSVTANLSGTNLALLFNEGGSSVAGQGTLTGTTITGNYSITGSTCLALQGVTGFPAGYDSGGFVANLVPNLSSTFTGTLNLPNGTDNAAFTLSQNSDHSLNLSAQLTGPIDNGVFTLTGSAVGNVMFVSGTVSGNPLTLFGYFDRSGTYTKFPNSLLVFNYVTLTEAGLLLGQ